MEDFPKTVKLKDNTTVVIRPLAKQDGPALLKFFAEIPEEDRLFLKDDVTKKEVIDRWVTKLDFDNVMPIVAEKDSDIVKSLLLYSSKYEPLIPPSLIA